MKKIILTVSIIASALISNAQVPAKKDSIQVHVKSLTVKFDNQDDATNFINVLNVAKETILKSSNANTTEQNLNIINAIGSYMDKFKQELIKQLEPKKEK